jgi:hypothetical protein
VTGLFRRMRERRPVRLVAVCCGLLPVLLAAPAIANACPKWSKVKAFRGGVFTAVDESASGSDNNGGTVTVELDRSGSVHVDFPRRTPKSGSRLTEFLGGTGGGKLSVHDTYVDDDQGQLTTGQQNADGPDVADNPMDLSFLVLYPSSCTYQLHVSFAVETTSTGDWPMPPDPGAGGVAVTPRRRIPSNLQLHGVEEVPAYYEGCAGSNPEAGCYEYAGLDGGYEWAQEFDMLKTCGSVVASSCGPEGQREGSATVNWNIKPYPPPKKKKRHK